MATDYIQKQQKLDDEVYVFLAYLIVCDGQIDDREVRLLNSLLLEASDETMVQVQAVFADQEDKPGLSAILEHLNRSQNEAMKREAAAIAMTLALIDGYLDPAEQSMILQCFAQWGIPETEFGMIKQDVSRQLLADSGASEEDEEKAHPFFYSRIAAGLMGLASRIAGRGVRERIQDFQTKLLLSGPEYTGAIEVCGKVAEEDFRYVQPILEQSGQSLQSLLRDIHNTTANMKDSKDKELDVKGTLEALQQSIEQKLHPLIHAQQQSLLKKKRAMHSFTISFLGKTKAGKSTLHSIVTGEGAEAIGKGKQRTTRFNRIYNWKNIRIIDTPGIGAPGGKSDEEIAASVIDESDVICYVMKNDSVQESEFRFLGSVREKNKPFIILLNLKENLMNEVRLKEHLQNPEHMYTRTDEKSIQGHVDRIRNYVSQHYRKDQFEIIPVQLLAAQMSRMDNYAEHADILFKSSRVGKFLNSLRLAIIEDGVLRRSQTLLDGALHTVDTTRQAISRQAGDLAVLMDKVRANHKKAKLQLEKSFTKHAALLQQHAGAQFARLREQIPGFAGEYYDESEDTIQSAWTDRVSSSGFDKSIRSGLENQVTAYINEVEKYLHEMVEDLAISEERLKAQGLDIQTSSTFSSKNLLRLISAGGGIIGTILLLASNPIGWIIGGIAGIIGFFSGLFKSKETKIREAIEKLESSMNESVDKQEDELKPKIAKHFSDVHENITKLINDYFNELIRVSTRMHKRITEVEEELAGHSNRLNRALAWRILNYARQEKSAVTELNDAVISRTVAHVDRDYGTGMTIYTQTRIPEKRLKEVEIKLQEALAVTPVPKSMKQKGQAG